jgi:hypothetical protein
VIGRITWEGVRVGHIPEMGYAPPLEIGVSHLPRRRMANQGRLAAPAGGSAILRVGGCKAVHDCSSSSSFFEK